MRVITIDDEQIALDNLKITLEECSEISEIFQFRFPKKALEWLTENKADIAFIDINMKQMSGLMLAKKLKERCPACAVVFVTAYSEYALQAFRLHASGYLLKPATVEDVREELEYIINPPARPKIESRQIQIQCFGNFEVFFGKEPVRFKYTKTKELLAYLIDRQGAFCDIGTLCAVLWENKEESVGLKSQLRNLIADLSSTMKGLGYENILTKRRGSLAILIEQIKCDYYDWLKGDVDSINQYVGEYMVQYSWAEMTAGMLTGYTEM